MKGRWKDVGGELEGMGRGLKYVKGTTLYEGNEANIEVGGTLVGSEVLGRRTLRGVKTCIEVVMRGGTWVGMLGRVVEIVIEGSIVVEGRVYSNSWAHYLKVLAWILIRWDTTQDKDVIFNASDNLLSSLNSNNAIEVLVLLHNPIF